MENRMEGFGHIHTHIFLYKECETNTYKSALLVSVGRLAFAYL